VFRPYSKRSFQVPGEKETGMVSYAKRVIVVVYLKEQGKPSVQCSECWSLGNGNKCGMFVIELQRKTAEVGGCRCRLPPNPR
jgi:hypothetical protein